jgi:anthranilate/para-aminobenzoate synthase component I
VLSAGDCPLVLAPGSARGWFEGRAVVAWRPTELLGGLTFAQAAERLDRAYLSRVACLSAALLPYDGPAVAARYAGGLVLTQGGWRTWGTLDASEVPAPVFGEPVMLPHDAPLVRDAIGDMDAASFQAGVDVIIDSICEGDVYVVNLTRRLCGRPTLDAVDAFRALLARTNPDMAAFWRTPDVTIASASPERFLRVAGRKAHVSPIKGTRPRGRGDDDAALAAELFLSEKERAEHVMIVDLERNDLGRVCEPGTIAVDPIFEVVATPYCHQMVSTVTGTLLEDTTLSELLESVFPCGSVTGAPKIAAMKAIAAQEASPRAAYTGSLTIAVPGQVDSSILIRTAEYTDGLVRWGTGGGITVDSDPHEEWLETVLKASPFLASPQ